MKGKVGEMVVEKWRRYLVYRTRRIEMLRSRRRRIVRPMRRRMESVGCGEVETVNSTVVGEGRRMWTWEDVVRNSMMGGSGGEEVGSTELRRLCLRQVGKVFLRSHY